MKNILNIDALEFAGFPGGLPEAVQEKFGGTIAQIGMKLGTQKLGINITACPPGKSVFPFHSHRLNEELFYVLEGEGQIRLGSETYPVRKGDFVFCPPGGPDTAHQLRNTGSIDLKYLAISTKEGPEIAEYPDSGKFGVMDGKGFRFIGKVENSLGYWDGEA
jgi:uncharacterized cupin superfamily protein